MEVEFFELQRQQAVIRAKDESAVADMKQHADKLIQGFEKLDESHARRAIWELVQNASDLSDSCEITIDFSNGSFTFSHKGKPFTSNTLISLIKQVSSKTPDKNSEEVGQFGTGFITTHSFGKKFKINSFLDAFENLIEIKDFLIDRQAKDSTELVRKLTNQQNNVYSLIDEGKILSVENPTTTFTYFSETEYEKTNVIIAQKDLGHYAPIVMALNRKIKVIKVINNDGVITEYKRTNIENTTTQNKLTIEINGSEHHIFYLKSKDESIEIILPLVSLEETKLIEDSIAKLFLYFPLIGTENWGWNFIVNSIHFAPLEARDGIYLNSKNDQTKEKEENNRQIIEDASELIFAFIEQNAESITNPINLAYINFNIETDKSSLNEYFIKLKEKWVNKFITYILVETNKDRITPKDAYFIDDELLKNSNYYNSIYSIISFFWDCIPQKEISKDWTKIINEWGENESIERIYIKDIVESIEEKINLNDFDQLVLADFYKYLIEINEIEYFDNYKLLPNIKNEFAEKITLYKSVNIPVEFIEIADIIIPDVPRKFVNKDFELGQLFNLYNRYKLSQDFNTKLLEININKDNLLNQDIRNALIKLCSYFAPSIGGPSYRKQLIPKICEFYNLTYTEGFFQNIEDDKFDFDYTPFRVLVKNFFFEIIARCDIDSKYENWLEKNIAFYKECLQIIAKNSNIEDLIKTLPIFPNQNYELCTQATLKVEELFPLKITDNEYLKKIYENIVGKVKNELVLNDFADLLPERNVRTGLELSSKLEQVFKEAGDYAEINDHTYCSHIFEIVRKITDNEEWANFFPTLSDKRALIMMAKISDNDVKNDLFNIIGLEDKSRISLLGKLAKLSNLERIIELGKNALIQEKVENFDFEFKKKIGVHIEDLIREKIGHDIESFNVIVEEKQDGQDFIIKINEIIVYYIEVKSRWNKDNPIRMSKNQVTNAINNKDKYSLCCVEMSDYKVGQDDERYKVEDIISIIDRIKILNSIGEELEPLMKNIIIERDLENEITIDGDIKATIPRSLIKTGSDIDTFVDFLIEKLNLK